MLESLESRIKPREEYWDQQKGAVALGALQLIRKRAGMAMEERKAVMMHTGKFINFLPPFTEDIEEEAIRLVRRRGLE